MKIRNIRLEHQDDGKWQASVHMEPKKKEDSSPSFGEEKTFTIDSFSELEGKIKSITKNKDVVQQFFDGPQADHD